MKKSQKVALLWFLGGAALLGSGLMATPRLPLSIFAGLLFFVVGIVSMKRG